MVIFFGCSRIGLRFRSFQSNISNKLLLIRDKILKFVWVCSEYLARSEGRNFQHLPLKFKIFMINKARYEIIYKETESVSWKLIDQNYHPDKILVTKPLDVIAKKKKVQKSALNKAAPLKIIVQTANDFQDLRDKYPYFFVKNRRRCFTKI